MDIVTGDRDLYPAGRRRARRCGCCTRSRASGTLQLTDEACCARSTAWTAAGYADLALLRGDPSDGLPGVPGIGEKTAAKLLAHVRGSGRDHGGGRRPGVRAHPGAAQAAAGGSRPTWRSRPKVVRVAADVPLPEVDPTLPVMPRDPQALDALARRWGLGGSLQRLLVTLGGA